MGFSLIGLKAQNKTGEYFQNNIWWWRPLAEFVLDVYDDFLKIEEKKYWQSNDAQKISAKTAISIADRLDSLIKSGTVKRYADKYNEEQNAEPDIDCWICNGTGNREGWVYYKNGERKFTDEWAKQCNGCNVCYGTGKIRPFSTYYLFDVENLKIFADFCRYSGGFEII